VKYVVFQVLPGLYVGNYRDSKDACQLERFEITHIVAIHDAARKLHSVSKLSRLELIRLNTQLLSVYAVHLCVLFGSQNEHSLFHCIALTDTGDTACSLPGKNLTLKL